MANASHKDPRRMYSWWWDSHISPKNSKWLQENLTDMDAKVKQMIKLIEEDADSFARRAEMYYKKRPELMKMVEEFYRAYRALAERYDHATGVLRQAHRTMAEAFPNQVPLMLADDSSAGAVSDTDPRTPEMPPPVRASFDPDELQKDALALSPSHFHAVKRNATFTEESDSVISRKGLKQLNDLFGSGEAANHGKFAEGRARKGLNFHNAEEKDHNVLNNGSHDRKARVLSESERVGRAEAEISNLKNALAKLEAEKEAGILQYQQSLERLSKLESEVSRAQEDSRDLNERASKAEDEVQTLKESLVKLEAEREANLFQYQQCLDKICCLEEKISCAQKDAGEQNERASNAKAEAEVLRQDLARVEAEKETALLQYKQCLEIISNLKEKLLHTEKDVTSITGQAVKAESEVETLKQALAKLTEEKETAALQYQQCLETISDLEHKIARVQEEAQRLNGEIDEGITKLKGAEERCAVLEKANQTMHSELESLLQQMENQSQELTEKQKELGRLWTCIQEERLRFVEAETAFQALQHLHSQSQEELRSLAAELQTRAQVLKEVETCNKVLNDEVQKVKEENRSLSELNLSSSISIENLQDEISSLRETIRKLEAEVELRVDQRNALQQEIYCLKEELNAISNKHQVMMHQIESAGLDPQCFESSVRELQDNNTMLKEVWEKDRSEKLVLLEKLAIMEKLLERNSFLENSLCDLNVELEGVREKVKSLEESCQSLLGEKSTIIDEKTLLVSQLQIATENLEKLSEKNTFLENSLSDANAEIEGLNNRLRSTEDSCLLLQNEKSGLIIERESLISQVSIAQERLEDLEKRSKELGAKYSDLQKERESALCRIEELQLSLNAEKQEYADFAKVSEIQLVGMDVQNRFLQEEGDCMKKLIGEEKDKAVNAEIEIFILQQCLQDLEEKNFSISEECQKLMEASKLSQKLISQLRRENCEQLVEVNSLFGQINSLKLGLCQVLKTLEFDADHQSECEDKADQCQALLNHILIKLQQKQNDVFEMQEENQQLVIENSIFVAMVDQLKLAAGILASERDTLDRKFRLRLEQYLALQREKGDFVKVNEELRKKLMEGEQQGKVFKSEIESLHGKMVDMQGAYNDLCVENSKVLDERQSLMKQISSLEEDKQRMEEENCLVFAETMSQSILSLIFKDISTQNLVEIKELIETLGKLHHANDDFKEKVGTMERLLEVVRMENLQLKESLEKSENEAISMRTVNCQLNNEIADGRNLLCQKENELVEAGKLLRDMQDQKSELLKMVEDLKGKHDEVTLIQENQEIQILKLSEAVDYQSKQTELIRDANQQLHAELRKLHEELKETKSREERTRNEVELWETQAATFFSDFQISVVHEALAKGKVYELVESYGNLADRSNLQGREIAVMEERVSTLEGENGGLKSQFTAYVEAVNSLNHCVTSLENHTALHRHIHNADSKEAEDSDLMHQPAKSLYQVSEGQNTKVPDGFSDLQDMQTRIKAIEEAILEMERLAMLENLDSNSKLEAAMREIEKLKYESSSRRESVLAKKQVNPKREEELRDGTNCDHKPRNPTREIYEEWSETMPKDIMLDEASECSSHGISRRETVEVDDQMLELWETSGRSGSIDLKVAKAQKANTIPINYNQIAVAKGKKSRYPSSESLIEKELGVDKLEISKRFSEPEQEGNKRKILERLDSDVQKLTNLQITVQDLKRKVEITEKSRKGKGIEFGTVKEQLEEAEEAIIRLFDVNRKLMANAEEVSLTHDGISAMETDENGSVRKRRISEQARRGSEKIGRLQLEVQKIQFLLLKLDEEKESRGRTKISDHKTRVLLRDYLYGGKRTNQKRKKAHFCACVQPPTKGD